MFLLSPNAWNVDFFFHSFVREMCGDVVVRQSFYLRDGHFSSTAPAFVLFHTETRNLGCFPLVVKGYGQRIRFILVPRVSSK